MTNKQTAHSSSYRPDIDGLRTIAIITVVIFHAWPQFMPGGFFGVDVFFVISGYLISGILIKQAILNKFSYINFYTRRIKRINPALIVVMVFMLIISCLKLASGLVANISITLGTVSLFAANIKFLITKQDYFSPDIKTLPFLHFWSLGVQQQFYIFWPFLIWIVMKYFRNKAIYFFSTFTLFSFILGVWYTYQDAQFAFYFPFCRFWQMAIGGIICYLNLKIKFNYINNVISILGVGGIMIIVWFIEQENFIPGWWALIPTLGAAFIIQAGSQAYINKYILSNKLFVFIGKISYPLYLWHWPLLVYCKTLYPLGSTSILSNTWFVVFLSFVCSILTYYLVEENIRYRKQAWVVIALFACTILIGIFSFIIGIYPKTFSAKLEYDQFIVRDEMLPTSEDFVMRNGKLRANSAVRMSRQPPNVDKIAASIYYDPSQKAPYYQVYREVNQTSPYFEPFASKLAQHYEIFNEGSSKKIFIIGDSHAKFASFRFPQLYNQSVKAGTQANFPTVLRILLDAYPFLPCSPIYDFTLNLIKKHMPQRVFFVNYWYYYMLFKDINGPFHYSNQCYHGFKNFMDMTKQSLSDVISDIQDYKKTMKQLVNLGVQVYVATIHIAKMPRFTAKFMMDENGYIQSNIQPIKLSQWRSSNKLTLDIFQSAMISAGVKLIDFAESYCFDDQCYPLIPTGYPIYRDDNHHANYYANYWTSSVDTIAEIT